MYEPRVLSGMRPTGSLHLGHYHGVLKNWVRLQAEYPCLYFVADWHALTTDYETPAEIARNSWDMVIDWLAAGIDPNQATLFIQSQVVEHAELHLLLSMMTPLGWLERATRPPDFRVAHDAVRHHRKVQDRDRCERLGAEHRRAGHDWRRSAAQCPRCFRGRVGGRCGEPGPHPRRSPVGE